MLKRHRQQLSVLEAVVEEVLEAIEESLERLPTGPTREVYERCRAADQQVAFARRFWSFFRERWDQRDDPALQPLLVAADEVIWSCYREPIAQIETEVSPAPLVYVNPEFSAHAIGRKNMPLGLRQSDQLLSRVVSELPVSLIGLPYSCVEGPWWLVLLAHEVGHQVAFAVDHVQRAPRIADLVGEAAKAAGAEPELQGRWRAWAHEVFADAFAAATVGAGHLWALFELEQGSDETMVAERPTYPPPIVRQSLVLALIERLGLAAAAAVPAPPLLPVASDLTVPESDMARIRRLLELVPSIACALATAEVVPGLTLPQLTDWDAAALGGAGAGWWQMQFRNDQASPEEAVEAARLASVGALAAWAEVADEEEATVRQERSAALREQILAIIPENRAPGDRGPEGAAEIEVGSLPQRVAAEVLKLPADELAVPEQIES